MKKIGGILLAGCVLALGFLMGMFLNKSKADGVQTQSADAKTAAESETDYDAAGEEFPTDIQSIIADSQENYAAAMRAVEEETAADGSTVSAVLLDDTSKNSFAGTAAKTNGIVAGDRNDGHSYFLEESVSETETDAAGQTELLIAAPEKKSDSDYQYTLYNDHVVITKYIGSASSLDIPDRIDGQPVTEIGNAAFSANKTLVRVFVPDSVEKMGDNAFKDCALLVDVNLSDGLSELGESAFEKCQKLVRVNIPEGITVIRQKTFGSCGCLRTALLPDSIETIDSQAFENCSALELTRLPHALKSIGSKAFYGCAAIAPAKWAADLEEIGDSAFAGCTGMDMVNISASVKKIGDSAFARCSGIQTLTIRSGLESVPKSAFADCTGITDLEIPKSVISIGDGAFSGCTALAGILIPKSTLSIGSSAFAGCIFQDVTVNAGCSYQASSFPDGAQITLY